MAITLAILTPNADAIIMLNEDFTGTTLPSGWSFDTDGEWSIENNELSQGRILTTPGHADCSAGDESWTDYLMSMRFKYIQFGTNNMEAGVTIRGTNNAGGMTVRTSWRGSSWNLELMRSGMAELHVPLNQNLTTGQWYDMKAKIEGDFLQVWVNDVLYDFGDIYPSSPTFPSAGKIGLWSNNAYTHFDDVLVDDLQPVPEPASMVLLGIALFGAGVARRKR